MPRMTFLSVRTLGLVAFAAGLALLTVLSLLPREALPPTGVWDKAQHTGAYFMVTAAGLAAFQGRRGMVGVALFMLAYGGVIEVLQGLTPDRTASLGDIVANAIGIAAAAGAAHLIRLVAGVGRSA